jgi:hypothetical protein
VVGDDIGEIDELPPAEPVCLGEAVQGEAGKVEEIGLGRDNVEARRPFLGDKLVDDCGVPLNFCPGFLVGYPRLDEVLVDGTTVKLGVA